MTIENLQLENVGPENDVNTIGILVDQNKAEINRIHVELRGDLVAIRTFASMDRRCKLGLNNSVGRDIGQEREHRSMPRACQHRNEILRVEDLP